MYKGGCSRHRNTTGILQAFRSPVTMATMGDWMLQGHTYMECVARVGRASVLTIPCQMYADYLEK